MKSKSSPRSRTSFNAGWRFRRGDAPRTKKKLSYQTLRPWVMATGTELINAGGAKPRRPSGNPGADVPFARPHFVDDQWKKLDLPHDWGIEGPFSQDLPGETGKLSWHGVGWYRKRFRLPKSDSRRVIELEIDGAMSFSSVWLNGHYLGGWPYGYSSYRLDLSEHAAFGAENVVAIRLENPQNSSRWYPGAGIYRNTWLSKTAKIRVVPWGVKVSTPRISAKRATVHVDVELENRTDSMANLEVSLEVFELDRNSKSKGRPAARASTRLHLDAGYSTRRTLVGEVQSPSLWSLEERSLYLAVVRINKGRHVLDRVDTRFGIRSIEADPDRGFLLNGKRIPIQGVCMHHDLGALGTAINVRALERQVELLQSMGANAIRTSHNPPAPELLDLCDRMGMLVMVEAFDCWRRGKKRPEGVDDRDPNVVFFDYATVFDDWHERDLRAMVRRDQNHPSVVMWSIGNEVIEQWYADGWKLAARLAGIVREEDRTRPITSAFNGEIAGYSGFQTAVDIVGYNYKPWEYRPFHGQNPSTPVLGAETSSCVSSRGEYFFPVSDDKLRGRENFHVSSYDLSATQWAMPPDQEFRALDEAPFVLGEFVWTGFDYLGEPTPYNSDSTNLLNFSDPKDRQRAKLELERLGRIRVPSRSSYFGIIDLAGFPKDRFFLYQARWRPELRMAHILPHWNWPERVGQVTPVHVYSSGDEAELFLNGRSLGKKKKPRLGYRFRWDDVIYEPGELRVVTYKKGKRWATATRKTAGNEVGIKLSGDRTRSVADGHDLVFVTASIVDAEGLVVPTAEDLLEFEVEGPADIVGVDNGDQTSFEPFIEKQRRAFNGLALVILRTRTLSGTITLVARGPGLDPDKLILKSR